MSLTLTPELRTKLVKLIETAYEAAELLNGCPDDEDAEACAQLLSNRANEIEVAILGADDRLDSATTPPEPEPQAEPEDDGRLAYPAFVLAQPRIRTFRRYVACGYIQRPSETGEAFIARCAEQDADDPPDSWVFAREFATHREQAT